MDQTDPPLRYADRQTGRDQGPFARSENDLGARGQVRPRVALVGIDREAGARVEQAHGDPGAGAQAAHSEQMNCPAFSEASWLR